MKRIFYIVSPIPLFLFLLIKFNFIHLGGGDPIGNGILFVIPLILLDLILSIVGLVMVLIAKKKGEPFGKLIIFSGLAILPIVYILFHL